jgi:probable rRNA maturation factor
VSACVTVEVVAVPAPPLPASKREIAALAGGVAKALGLDHAEFDLLLTHDAAIAELNRSFLGLTGPTNVLSFEDGESGSPGSIVISVDAVERESVLYGQNPLEHFARLLAHGLLHLSGMEHGDEMYELTERAVEAVIGG